MELEKENAFLQDEIIRERNASARLEDRMRSILVQNEEVLERVEKEVCRAMEPLKSKWGQEIRRLMEESAGKDRDLKELMGKMEEVCRECEEGRIGEESQAGEAARYRKKYESLKAERDEKVDGLLKKIDS